MFASKSGQKNTAVVNPPPPVPHPSATAKLPLIKTVRAITRPELPHADASASALLLSGGSRHRHNGAFSGGGGIVSATDGQRIPSPPTLNASQQASPLPPNDVFMHPLHHFVNRCDAGRGAHSPRTALFRREGRRPVSGKGHNDNNNTHDSRSAGALVPASSRPTRVVTTADGYEDEQVLLHVMDDGVGGGEVWLSTQLLAQNNEDELDTGASALPYWVVQFMDPAGGRLKRARLIPPATTYPNSLPPIIGSQPGESFERRVLGLHEENQIYRDVMTAVEEEAARWSYVVLHVLYFDTRLGAFALLTDRTTRDVVSNTYRVVVEQTSIRDQRLAERAALAQEKMEIARLEHLTAKHQTAEDADLFFDLQGAMRRLERRLDGMEGTTPMEDVHRGVITVPIQPEVVKAPATQDLFMALSAQSAQRPRFTTRLEMQESIAEWLHFLDEEMNTVEKNEATAREAMMREYEGDVQYLRGCDAAESIFQEIHRRQQAIEDQVREAEAASKRRQKLLIRQVRAYTMNVPEEEEEELMGDGTQRCRAQSDLSLPTGSGCTPDSLVSEHKVVRRSDDSTPNSYSVGTDPLRDSRNTEARKSDSTATLPFVGSSAMPTPRDAVNSTAPPSVTGTARGESPESLLAAGKSPSTATAAPEDSLGTARQGWEPSMPTSTKSGSTRPPRAPPVNAADAVNTSSMSDSSERNTPRPTSHRGVALTSLSIALGNVWDIVSNPADVDAAVRMDVAECLGIRVCCVEVLPRLGEEDMEAVHMLVEHDGKRSDMELQDLISSYSFPNVLNLYEIFENGHLKHEESIPSQSPSPDSSEGGERGGRENTSGSPPQVLDMSEELRASQEDDDHTNDRCSSSPSGGDKPTSGDTTTTTSDPLSQEEREPELPALPPLPIPSEESTVPPHTTTMLAGMLESAPVTLDHRNREEEEVKDEELEKADMTATNSEAVVKTAVDSDSEVEAMTSSSTSRKAEESSAVVEEPEEPAADHLPISGVQDEESETLEKTDMTATNSEAVVKTAVDSDSEVEAMTSSSTSRKEEEGNSKPSVEEEEVAETSAPPALEAAVPSRPATASMTLASIRQLDQQAAVPPKAIPRDYTPPQEEEDEKAKIIAAQMAALELVEAVLRETNDEKGINSSNTEAVDVHQPTKVNPLATQESPPISVPLQQSDGVTTLASLRRKQEEQEKAKEEAKKSPRGGPRPLNTPEDRAVLAAASSAASTLVDEVMSAMVDLSDIPDTPPPQSAHGPPSVPMPAAVAAASSGATMTVQPFSILPGGKAPLMDEVNSAEVTPREEDAVVIRTPVGRVEPYNNVHTVQNPETLKVGGNGDALPAVEIVGKYDHDLQKIVSCAPGTSALAAVPVEDERSGEKGWSSQMMSNDMPGTATGTTSSDPSTVCKRNITELTHSCQDSTTSSLVEALERHEALAGSTHTVPGADEDDLAPSAMAPQEEEEEEEEDNIQVEQSPLPLPDDVEDESPLRTAPHREQSIAASDVDTQAYREPSSAATTSVPATETVSTAVVDSSASVEVSQEQHSNHTEDPIVDKAREMAKELQPHLLPRNNEEFTDEAIANTTFYKAFENLRKAQFVPNPTPFISYDDHIRQMANEDLRAPVAVVPVAESGRRLKSANELPFLEDATEMDPQRLAVIGKETNMVIRRYHKLLPGDGWSDILAARFDIFKQLFVTDFKEATGCLCCIRNILFSVRGCVVDMDYLHLQNQSGAYINCVIDGAVFHRLGALYDEKSTLLGEVPPALLPQTEEEEGRTHEEEEEAQGAAEGADAVMEEGEEVSPEVMQGPSEAVDQVGQEEQEQEEEEVEKEEQAENNNKDEVMKDQVEAPQPSPVMAVGRVESTINAPAETDRLMERAQREGSSEGEAAESLDPQLQLVAYMDFCSGTADPNYLYEKCEGLQEIIGLKDAVMRHFACQFQGEGWVELLRSCPRYIRDQVVGEMSMLLNTAPKCIRNVRLFADKNGMIARVDVLHERGTTDAVRELLRPYSFPLMMALYQIRDELVRIPLDHTRPLLPLFSFAYAPVGSEVQELVTSSDSEDASGIDDLSTGTTSNPPTPDERSKEGESKNPAQPRCQPHPPTTQKKRDGPRRRHP